MFKGPRNALAGLLAAMCPSRLAYHVARRVVAHATLDRYADTRPDQLRALDALKHWHDAKVERPKVDLFAAFDRSEPRRPEDFRDLQIVSARPPAATANDAHDFHMPLGSFDPPAVDEDPDQVELVERALGRR